MTITPKIRAVIAATKELARLTNKLVRHQELSRHEEAVLRLKIERAKAALKEMQS